MSVFLLRRINNRNAFTLLELIVVISLIGTMLFFAVPRLDLTIFGNEKRKVSQWIVVNVDALKNSAVQSQKQFILNVDIDANSFWISNESMPPEEMDNARKNGFALPSGFRLIDVMYPNGNRISSGTAPIRFYSKGYSDRLIIHLEDNRNHRLSYYIEPFLSGVDIKETYAEY